MQLSNIYINNSDGSEMRTIYKYSSDYPWQSTSNPYAKGILTMQVSNIINQPIETVNSTTYNSSELIIQGTLNYFKTDESDRVFPAKKQKLETESALSSFTVSMISDNGVFISDDHYKDYVVYDLYDNHNNPLQYHEPDNINVSYLWGYNNMHPIIKGEHVTYPDLLSAVNSTTNNLTALLISIGDLLTESQKDEGRAFNIALRNQTLLINKLVTTYTYKPLVGITSITDPNGIATYYEYDNYGRLIIVRDHDGNIMKTYDYHYINQ